MADPSPLEHLADLAGIEAGFYDIFGRYYPTGDATRIALLEAMGLPAGDEAACRESLARLIDAPFQRGVPTAQVIPDEDPDRRAGLYLRQAALNGSFQWALVDEGDPAQRWTGDVAAEDLTDPPAIDRTPGPTHGLPLPADLPAGYYRLSVGWSEEGETRAAEGRLIVAPATGCVPEDLIGDDRAFGVAVQLYGLSREDDLGIGTFSHLADLAADATEAGAAFIGLNPLHAGYWADANQSSPYSPSSRDFLNVRAIDPLRLPELEHADLDVAAEAAALGLDLPALRGAALIDHPTVARLTDRLLALAYARFCDLPTDHPRKVAFAAFEEASGPALQTFALFQALQDHFTRAADGGRDLSRFAWWTWGEEYAGPDAPGAKAFAQEEAASVGFQAWLQFAADDQLAQAARAADAAGMRVGLYRDLAVGAGHASAAVWADRTAYIEGAGTGAPPDLLNRLGQDWGLAPFNPIGLEAAAFEPYIRAIRANMAHAGAIRIDHAMGLMHLYCVPPGLSAAEGAYVKLPFESLRRILALESQRNRCLVIGEALGTVPEGFRETLADAGVLSYRVLYFERVEGGLFARPDTYPSRAMVTVGTHDLSTLAGFWSGRDLEWRQQLNLYPNEDMRREDAESRGGDRRKLIDALIDQGLWPAEPAVDTDTLPFSADLTAAVHAFAARAPSRLMTAQAEDLLGMVEQANLPGTIDQHPNWRRRLPVTVDALFKSPMVAQAIAAIRNEGR